MKTQKLNESWDIQKGKLLQRFKILTNNDLVYADGSKKKLFEKLQIILGYSKKQLDEIISKL